MIFRADSVLLQYLHNRRNPVTLKAQNVIEAEGLVFVERCPECGGRSPESDAMTEVDSPSGVICTDCRAPWGTQTERRFIGEIRVAPDNRSSHEKLGKFIDIGLQFDRLIADKHTEWPIRYYVANNDGFSLRELTVEGPKCWGQRAPDTVYGVRKLVLEGRELWSAACRKIGIKV
jgi:hypothetical protein